MPEEGFLKRWSRLKATGSEAEAPRPAPGAPVSTPVSAPVSAPITAPVPVQADAPPQDRPLPTLADAARLTPDADFSSFVAKDVDKSVQRLALKRLFADPHFHVMDGLDMYMDDYNKPSPVSAAMLAALDHARSALRYPDAEKPAAKAAPAAGEHAVQAGAAPDAETDSGADTKRVGVASADADNVFDTEVQDAGAMTAPASHVSLPATPQQSLQGQA
ncbi:DUF3306 domain-containing protein [Massilia sp. YIM B02769]|uniref:DUF3306 domain-containing protein n=1 Tax=Massilia sp. YIM B02769 TaxID=3050129 RepID=UPI0025B65933|nr:DUF3306 domain-containing protein [Massilia sp. YIM B02769]MDN4058156.1 DUF3306 domain-containing protein [Massilia sp. YIM B02769]